MFESVPFLESFHNGNGLRSVVAGPVFGQEGEIRFPEKFLQFQHLYPIWLLGVPMQSSEGEVDLEVSIRRPDGAVLGTYNGRSEFSDWYTMYNQSIHGVGTALNKAFNQAMQQIRERIIADKNKF